MIVGTKNNILTYKGISKNLDTAIDFIVDLDENIENGKYVINDDVYAMVSEGEGNSEGEVLYEVHRKYIDLQYILKGEDLCYYAPIHKCTGKIPYDSEKDAEFLLSDEGYAIKFKPEDFYILHPFDAHGPCRAENGEKPYFKKVVVKVKI